MVRVSRKCPKGTFCIENMTLVGVMLIFTFLVGVAYKQMEKYYTASSKSTASREENTQTSIPHNPIARMPIVGGSLPPEMAVHQPLHIQRPQDVLSDPRRPPLQDTQALYGLNRPHVLSQQTAVGIMPINQPTQHPYHSSSARDMNYHQLGILTRKTGEKILPLMGRRSQTQRNNWQYYTMSDGNQAIRLPISKNGQSCTRDNGCDEVMNGDTVYVEGYQEAFQATVYENDSPQYIPYLV